MKQPFRPSRLLILAGIALMAGAALPAQNPFDPPTAREATGGRGIELPVVRGPGAGLIIRWSHQLQQAIASMVRAVRDERDWAAAATAFLLAIVFGAVHIAGPGHGKVFAVSYFSGRPAAARDGILYSAFVSVIDSASAFLVVILGYVVLHAVAPAFRLQAPRLLQMVSYGLVVAFGVVHLAGHAIRHRHAAHCEGAEHGCGQKRHGVGDGRRGPFLLALSVGLIPCPLSTLLFVYGVVHDVVPVMVFMVVGVSLGGFLTMCAITLLVINGRQALMARLASGAASRLGVVLEYAASVAIIGVGALLLVAAVS